MTTNCQLIVVFQSRRNCLNFFEAGEPRGAVQRVETLLNLYGSILNNFERCLNIAQQTISKLGVAGLSDMM